MRKRILILVLALPGLAAAAEPSAMSVDDITECVKRSSPQRSTVQSATLRTVAKSGAVNESKAKIYWQKVDEDRSRAMVRFSAPPDLRGSALLVLQKEDDMNDLFMYLPEFRSVRRVTTGMMSGSMFGSDFTFEEFERLYRLASEMDSTRIGDARIGDRPSFAIENTPQNAEDSAYTRIVQYIEQERCVPLRTEFFGPAGKPIKVMSVDPSKLQPLANTWIPDQVLMEDLKRGSHTALILDKSEIDVEISERTFSQGALGRGR